MKGLDRWFKAKRGETQLSKCDAREANLDKFMKVELTLQVS